MRVNPNPWAMMLNTLNQVTAEEDTALQQVSTGKKLNVPSDDPAGMAMLIQNQAQQSECDQYQQNISTIQSSLQSGDSALNSIITSMTRAITLGVEGASGTVSASDRSAIANEVSGIADQVLSLANTTFNGSYLFAGAKTTGAPFSQSAGAVTYQGDSTTLQVPVGDGSTIAANTPGNKLFMDTGVFTALQALVAALQNGSGVDTATQGVRTAFDSLSAARVGYGTSLQQLEAANTFQSSNKVQFQTQENALSGVDLAEAASRLSNAENARNATLAAASRIAQTSLLDYLGTSGM